MIRGSLVDIAISSSNGLCALHLHGRFDFGGRQEFTHAKQQALAGNERAIEVDLSGVEYIDSSALGMLLILREKALSAGKTVSLATAGGAVHDLIQIANFDKLFASRVLPQQLPGSFVA